MITKHVAIMLTDIKGFTSRTAASSRLETMELLKKHKDIVTPILGKHSGHIVKTIGDAFLVTFESPTEAVICGIEIQEALKKHNEGKESAERIDIRIAINSGEVAVSEDGDIFGEAVNITSRLESIAEAGQVFFTEAVYLAMNKKEVPSSEIGYRQFKGVPEKIKVYRVLSEIPIGEQPSAIEAVTASFSGEEPGKAPQFSGEKAGFWRRFAAIAIDAVIFLVIISVLGLSSGPVVKVTDENKVTKGIEVEGLSVDNGKVKIKGGNGEEISISKKEGLKVSANAPAGKPNKRIPLKMFLWVLYGGVLVWRLGATPGKMILKIKVVDFVTGDKPAADKAFLRAVFSLVSLVLFLGYLWAIWEKDKRTWHDLIAGTKAVRS